MTDPTVIPDTLDRTVRLAWHGPDRGWVTGTLDRIAETAADHTGDPIGRARTAVASFLTGDLAALDHYLHGHTTAADRDQAGLFDDPAVHPVLAPIRAAYLCLCQRAASDPVYADLGWTHTQNGIPIIADVRPDDPRPVPLTVVTDQTLPAVTMDVDDPGELGDYIAAAPPLYTASAGARQVRRTATCQGEMDFTRIVDEMRNTAETGVGSPAGASSKPAVVAEDATVISVTAWTRGGDEPVPIEVAASGDPDRPAQLRVDTAVPGSAAEQLSQIRDQLDRIRTMIVADDRRRAATLNGLIRASMVWQRIRAIPARHRARRSIARSLGSEDR